MGTDPWANDLTRRIDAAIAEVYRTESHHAEGHRTQRHRSQRHRSQRHRAMQALGAFGAPAVDRVLELYRGSTTGPLEHARLLNALGNGSGDAQAAARRAVARACPRLYVDRLQGHLGAGEIGIVAEIHDPRVTSLLITRLTDSNASVRCRAATALIGRVEGQGNDDRPSRALAERAVLDQLDDESLPVRAVAAYAVARRSRADGITAYQQILRPTEPETLVFTDVQHRIAALRRGESVPPPI